MMIIRKKASLQYGCIDRDNFDDDSTIIDAVNRSAEAWLCRAAAVVSAGTAVSPNADSDLILTGRI